MTMQVFTHNGTQVFVSSDGVSFILLNGYGGGLRFGMSDSLQDEDGHDDGIQRQFKATSQGAESNIPVRHIPGDAGQALVKSLCPLGHSGHGFIRAVYHGGRTVTAQGIFSSNMGAEIGGGSPQGFDFTFSQQEPETEE